MGGSEQWVHHPLLGGSEQAGWILNPKSLSYDGVIVKLDPKP